MKGKKIVYLAALLIVLGLTLNAEDGYQGPGLTPITVEDAKELGRLSRVALRGKIVAFLWAEINRPVLENYVFSDETGSIILTIDKRLWKGISINENDLVEVTGYIIDGELSVHRIKKL
jgi:uncharacterized protein (TIGR00156 family)